MCVTKKFPKYNLLSPRKLIQNQNPFSAWTVPRIPLVVGELTTRPDLLSAEDGQTLAIPVAIDAFVVRF